MGATRSVEALGADFLWVVYHDYTSLGRAKAVTRDRFAEAVERGVTFAKANWDIAIDDELIPHPGFAADSGDFIARPDLATLVRLPHRPRVAQAFSDLLDEDGRPWDGDPRGRLRHQVEELGGLGLTARVAFEAEFQLMRPGEGGWEPADHGRMFTVDEIEARWAWCEQLLDGLSTMHVPVHQLGKEYGIGQYELSLLPADPVTAVDRYLLARQLVKALARDAGLVATFMPKPRADAPGNGLHVHVSLWNADGTDATADPRDPAALSALGGAAVAGLLDHAGAQAAIGSATPNSYKRLLPGSWAPAHVCWAFGNRAALVRVPSRGAGRRLEYRSGDASGSPYLHLAGLLAAIIDGIRRRAAPPAPVNDDIGHWPDELVRERGIARLPGSLEEALAALEGDDLMLEMLGPIIAEHYPAVKTYEASAYRAALAASGQADSEVTEWERTTYLEPL
ncbi:MAG: glutamine synthetase family protein [Chloroflexota bacterium]